MSNVGNQSIKRKYEKKIYLSEEVLQQVVTYQHQNYITRPSQALLQLVLRGLQREKEHNNLKPRKNDGVK